MSHPQYWALCDGNPPVIDGLSSQLSFSCYIYAIACYFFPNTSFPSCFFFSCYLFSSSLLLFFLLLFFLFLFVLLLFFLLLFFLFLFFRFFFSCYFLSYNRCSYGQLGAASNFGDHTHRQIWGPKVNNNTCIILTHEYSSTGFE